MNTTYADFISHATTSFLRTVATIVTSSVSSLYGTCRVSPCPGSATLKFEGVDVANRQLVIHLRLVPKDEFTLTLEVTGTHAGSSIFEELSLRTDSLRPEVLAAVVLSRYRSSATMPAAV